MRRGAGLALAVAVLGGAAHADDVLIIRDGTRRRGVVSGCREDACTLDGATVARGLIAVGRAAAGRRRAAGGPRSDRGTKPTSWTGSVVNGEFGGLSLGAVAIGDSSFDRDEVAWIRFAGPEPAATPRPSPARTDLSVLAFPPGFVFAAAALATSDSTAFHASAAPSSSPRPSPGAARAVLPQPPPAAADAPATPGSSPQPTRDLAIASAGACGPVPFGFAEEDGGRWIGTMKGRVHSGGGHLVNTHDRRAPPRVPVPMEGCADGRPRRVLRTSWTTDRS